VWTGGCVAHRQSTRLLTGVTSQQAATACPPPPPAPIVGCHLAAPRRTALHREGMCLSAMMTTTVQKVSHELREGEEKRPKVRDK
jgi:hypothetical protein